MSKLSTEVGMAMGKHNGCGTQKRELLAQLAYLSTVQPIQSIFLDSVFSSFSKMY